MRSSGLAEPQIARWLAEGADGEQVGYLQCKLILQPDRLAAAGALDVLTRIVARGAAAAAVPFEPTAADARRPRVREVLFLDTGAYDLYANRFIVRRRVRVEAGVPVGEPEIVLKHRHDGLARPAALDLRPRVDGRYEEKLKLEVLPAHVGPGGMRRLLSRTVGFGLGAAPAAAQASLASPGPLSVPELTRLFPALRSLPATHAGPVATVNRTVVEELLQDVGRLHVGPDVATTARVALWRTRVGRRPLIGELAFQLRLRRHGGIGDEALEACERVFLELQRGAAGWLERSTTKTGAVYRLGGRASLPTE